MSKLTNGICSRFGAQCGPMVANSGDIAMTGEARFHSLWREESIGMPRSVSLRSLARWGERIRPL